MLFVLMASDMMEDEVVRMHLLNVLANGCVYGVVVADGISRMSGSRGLVESFNNAIVPDSSHLYRHILCST